VRLSPDTLGELPDEVARYSYDRDAQAVGIVHFGIGAFARAHLAVYCDAAMAAGESGWMISGVSLRSDSVAQQLNPQGGLYTLTQRSGDEIATRVIGSIREVLVAGKDAEAIAERIASPDCRIVSFTITEKGYCRKSDGALDLDLAEKSFYPLLAEGLRRRRTASLPGVTLLSCDNLPDNGGELARLLGSYTHLRTRHISMWVPDECSFPSTMVDRIVPATSASDLDVLARRIGLRDEGAIFTERFSQWVIEDRFAGPRPRWEEHGVEIVSEVAPYEAAKLRMLNGAHSFLAYCGLLRGHEFVHQAIADPELRLAVDRLMRVEAAGGICPAPGQDLTAYADALVARFEDPALNHRLVQIAMDGSQKIPQRWLGALAEAKGQCPAILTGIAAWLLHIVDGKLLDDPLAKELRAAVDGKEIVEQVLNLFGPKGLLASAWMPSAADIAFIERAHAELGRMGEDQ
jgi:fructuronate reductase